MTLALLAGLLVPWVVGTAAMVAIGPRWPVAPWFRRLGYGFFLGMVAVAFAIRLSAHLAGGLSAGWAWVTLAVLGIVAVFGAWWRNRRSGGITIPYSPGADHPTRSVIVAVLMIGIGAHLLLSAIEIIALPLFPWDAWTVWAFRAKAWFLNGAIFDFVNLGQWLSTDDAGIYTQPALSYPLLPSILPLWAAMALGQWHEALINVPVVFCGLAIVLGLYGQSRAVGVRQGLALLGVFLLVSTPIFATHLSLGGYADIWLAGFAGLGFVSLMVGTIHGERSATWLGLLMLALGLLVKAEGFVWMAAGLAYVLLTALPARKGLALVATALVAVAVVLWWQPGTFELPGVGRVGVENGAIHVPLKGAIPFAANMVGDAYLQNIFVRDNWHLAWLALTILVPLCGFVDRPSRRATLTFIGLAGLAQVLIFGFTAQGAWAEDYTAINRLPLHVYPAVVFAGMVLAERLLCRHGAKGGRVRIGGRRRMLVVLGGALVTTLVLLAGWLWVSTAEDGGPPDALPLSGLSFVVGQGQSGADGYVIEQYGDGVALLSSGPVSIDADRLDLLVLNLRMQAVIDDPNRAPAFFWRRQDEEETVSRLTLLGGDELVDLKTSEDWHGTVTEVGFLVLEDAGPAVTISGLRLENSEPMTVARLLAGEWFGYEPWTQRSAHSLTGGEERQHAPLPALVSVFVLLTAGLAAWLGPRGRRVELVMIAILAGWVMLDIRWLGNRLQRAEKSLASLSLSVESRLSDPELTRLDPWISRILDGLPDEHPQRILVLSDPEEPKYYAWRSKYQLLPHNAAVFPRLPSPEQVEGVDFIMVIGDFMDPSKASAGVRERVAALPLDPAVIRRTQLVSVTPHGMLLAVPKPVGDTRP